MIKGKKILSLNRIEKHIYSHNVYVCGYGKGGGI